MTQTTETKNKPACELDFRRHVRIKDGLLVEHWDVIEDEASPQSSKSGLPMFGDKFVDAEAHELTRTEEIE